MTWQLLLMDANAIVCLLIMVRLMFFNTSVPEKDFRTRLMWMDALIVHLPEGLCG